MELWTLIVAIAAIIVAAAVAYHIAVRQGTFAKPALYTSFGPPAEEELPRIPVQMVLIAVPRDSPGYLVVGLPLIAQNRGIVPIRNLWINLEYASTLAVQANPSVVAVTGAIRWPDQTRAESRSPDRLTINHELPLIRPQETMILGEPVVFCTGELPSDPGSYRTFPIFLQSIAENARRRRGYVQLVFVRADNLEDLQSHFSSVVQKIDEEGGSLIASMASVIVSRLFRRAIHRIPCLLIIPRLRALSPAVSVDDTLLGASGTGYQTADYAVYIRQLPTGETLSWREAKQLRNARPRRFN